MLAPNKYPWQTWNTGDTVTAADWQKLVDAVKNADRKPMCSEFYRNYWYLRNTKDLHTGGGYSNYMSSYTTLSIDSTYPVLNNQGVKSLVNSTSYPFYNGWYQTGLSWNMLAFNDGSTTTYDKVSAVISLYFSDVSKFTALYIRFGSNTSNYYQYSYSAASLQNGYNIKAFDLNACSTTGSPPAWSAITYFEIWTYNNVNSNATYWIMDHLQIMRNDTTDIEPYSMQQSDGDDTAWTKDIPRYGYWFQNAIDASGTTWPSPGFIRPSSTVSSRVLDLDEQLHRSFYAKVVLGCKIAGKTMSVRWEVDANNYIQTYIDGDTLYLSKCVAGGVTTKSVALGISLTKNAQVTYTVWKEDTHFVVIVAITGMNPKILECSHISTDEGVVTTGMPVANAISFLYAWVVSHNPALIMATISNDYVW